MHVIVKCRIPDYFENGDHALIELSEDLILTLDKRMTAAKRAYEDQFYGMKWWDYTPEFTTVGPDLIGPDGMDEEEYNNLLESNYFVPFPDYDPERCKLEFSRMSPCCLTVCCARDGVGSFYWTGTEKHSGARVESYELHESALDEWAELIGCAEKLRQVRRAQGR